MYNGLLQIIDSTLLLTDINDKRKLITKFYIKIFIKVENKEKVFTNRNLINQIIIVLKK